MWRKWYDAGWEIKSCKDGPNRGGGGGGPCKNGARPKEGVKARRPGRKPPSGPGQEGDPVAGHGGPGVQILPGGVPG